MMGDKKPVTRREKSIRGPKNGLRRGSGITRGNKVGGRYGKGKKWTSKLKEYYVIGVVNKQTMKGGPGRVHVPIGKSQTILRGEGPKERTWEKGVWIEEVA